MSILYPLKPLYAELQKVCILLSIYLLKKIWTPDKNSIFVTLPLSNIKRANVLENVKRLSLTINEVAHLRAGRTVAHRQIASSLQKATLKFFL